MQQRDGGGVLWPFDPVHVTTFLAGKSEMEVGFMSFRPRSRRCHLPHMHGGGFCVVSSPFASPPPPLACKSETEVDFYVVSTLFAPPPPPRMQERVRGGILGSFDPVHAASTSLACKSESEVVLWPFDPVRAATTSLACNSETEVDFMSFRPLSHRHHLPRMQERDGGGFLRRFDPVRAATTSLACKSESEVDF
jgi:hypothetical protein